MRRIASSSGATASAGSNGRSAVDVGGGADRRLDDGADAGLDLEGDAEAGERGGDVGEQDRRVHAEPADRLEGDLRAQGGSRVISTSEARSRMARNSGSERPAWRMNQTGVTSMGSRRQARR